MKTKFGVFASFFGSLCVVCAYLFLLLFLGSLTGCTSMAATEVETPSLTPAGTDPALSESSASGENTEDPPLDSLMPSIVESTVPPNQGNENPPSTQNPPPAQSGSGNETDFQSVLQGNTPFFSTDANRSLNINELGQTVSSDSSITVKPIKFATVDLDGDDVQEVVLWLQVGENDSYGFEILRQQGGQIYGYTLVYRAFMDLKNDGTFSFSSGAADNGFGSILFTDKSYKINKIAYSESAYDANNELTVSYFVNGQVATEAEFLSAVEKQYGKESILWYDFNDRNIVSVLN